jgi:hypothetical protein
MGSIAVPKVLARDIRANPHKNVYVTYLDTEEVHFREAAANKATATSMVLRPRALSTGAPPGSSGMSIR